MDRAFNEHERKTADRGPDPQLPRMALSPLGLSVFLVALQSAWDDVKSDFPEGLESPAARTTARALAVDILLQMQTSRLRL
jgi:hypothetical protein